MNSRVQDVIHMVARAFGVTYGGIVAGNRNGQETLARHVAMYVARKALGISLPEIGREMHRDHTSVLHGVRRIESLCSEKPEFKALIESLVAAIEYREAARHSGEIDVLGLARSIAHNPRRNAAAASVQEVAALAFTFIDLWEVVSAAEALIADLAHCQVTAEDAEQHRVARIAALATAIGDEINLIAGPAEPGAIAEGETQWKP